MSLEKVNTILYASDLIGHDGRTAFRVAAQEAISHNAKLIFLNVVEPISSTAEKAVSNYLSDEQLDELRTKGIERIQSDIAERIKNFCGEELPAGAELPYEPVVRVEKGAPAEAILEVAKSEGVDMIVVGTRTHSKFSQLMLGSTAHRVLFHAKCPVLVVPIS